MTKVISKIKSMFSEELLRYIAAVCDTKRIESNNKKMIVLGDLLYTYGIDFEILGGATNRIALQIDGYAVKFALDDQGYMDNLVEYSLSQELQPDFTKSFETNGYILVQNCIEMMSKSAFQLYKVEIYKILDKYSKDYLLGDVGYLEKNRANWGIWNNKPVILDYAYCHRATENLFTCDKCGSALRYDSVYDKLICTDRSGCKAVYTYNQRKRIQGKQVDIDMINEKKKMSIVIGPGEISKEIEMFEDRLIGDNYFIIDNPEDMYAYDKLKEESLMKLTINGGEDMTSLEERFAAMVDLAKNPNDRSAKEIVMSSITDDVPEAIYTDNYQENYMYNNGRGLRIYSAFDHCNDEEEDNDCNDFDYDSDDDMDINDAFANMIDQIKQKKEEEEKAFEEAKDNQVKEYIESKKLNESKVDTTVDVEEVTIETESNSTDEPKETVVITEKIIAKEEVKPEPKEVVPDVSEAPILINGRPLVDGEEVIL